MRWARRAWQGASAPGCAPTSPGWRMTPWTRRPRSSRTIPCGSRWSADAWSTRARCASGSSPDTSDVREPAIDLALAAQAHDDSPLASSGQELRVLAPAARLVRERIAEQRVAAPERVAPGLPVVVPERLLAQHAAQRAPHEPREPHAGRQVQPHDRIRGVEHQGPDLAVVVAVDDPAVLGEDRVQRRPELVVGGLGPA